MVELIRKLVDENARATIDPDAYDRHYTEVMARYETAKVQLTTIEGQRLTRKAIKRILVAFHTILKETGPLVEFDEGVWNTAVGNAMIYSNGLVTFAFRNGIDG